MALAPFHLAIPVYDLAAARHFYGEVFGCAEGRSSEHWVDFDFFGHQLVIHEAPKMAYQEAAVSNPVDGHDVPVPHFGVVLGAGRAPAQPRDAVRHRALRALQGPSRRAGDHVPSRSLWQRSGVQGVQGHRPAVRQVSARCPGSEQAPLNPMGCRSACAAVRRRRSPPPGG